MNERILVRGELSRWVHVGRVVTALVVFAGLLIGGKQAIWAWVIAGIALIFGALLEIKVLGARRVRTWLTIHEDSFDVETADGDHTIDDLQVAAMSFEVTRDLSNGTLKSHTRKLLLWVGEQREPLQMRHKLALGADDPLGTFIPRLLEKVQARLEKELRAGGTVRGDGWQLSRTMLTIGQAPREQQIPVNELAAVEIFSGQMCVWRRGQEAAVAKLPLAGKNVHLLPSLVQPYLNEQKGRPVAESTSGLGRVLFERRPSTGMIVTLILGGILIGVIGISTLGVMHTREGQRARNKDFLIPLVAISATAVVMTASGFALRYSSFRCHELGVAKDNMLGKKRLRYQDMASFLYQATAHYYNGSYTGTIMVVKFRPLGAGATIGYSTTVKGDDDDLEALRDFISRAIAGRMADSLHAGNKVPWTANLDFAPDGIHYRPSGFLGRKEAQFLPYTEYRGHSMNQGVFYLFAKGQDKHITSEQVGADNFFPGFVLLNFLLHQPADEQAPSTTESH